MTNLLSYGVVSRRTRWAGNAELMGEGGDERRGQNDIPKTSKCVRVLEAVDDRQI